MDSDSIEIGRGAEAVIIRTGDAVTKKRLLKSYRVRELDERIRHERTIAESRMISMARRIGVPTPIIKDVLAFELTMEHIDGIKLKDIVNKELSMKAGELVGRLHSCGIIHGDLTTSNMMQCGGKLYIIDFGLAYHDPGIEAQGVDVHVYFQTLISTHNDAQALIEAFKDGYIRQYAKADQVLKRVEEIRGRGRYL